MKTSPVIAALAALPLLGLPLAAQEAPAPTPDSPEEASRATHAVAGEVMDVAGSRFAIRPYDVDLPKRLQVTLAEGARLFEQKKGKVEEIQRGDMVFVLEDLEPGRPGAPVSPEPSKEKPARPTTPTPSGPILPAAYAGGAGVEGPSTEPAPDAARQRTLLRARAVVRMWATRSADVTLEDVRAGRALYQNARPILEPKAKLQLEKWKAARTRAHVGVVMRLNPMVIQTMDRIRRFTLPEKMPVVNGVAVRPQDLKSGRSVTVRSRPGLQPDNSMEATLVAIGPRPRLSQDQIRNILLRDQGRKVRRTDKSD